MQLIIDVDGTILQYDGYRPGEFGQPIAGAIEFLQAQRDAGHTVILFSARPLSEECELREHLAELGIIDLVEELICGKPIGHVYIDDRGIRFNGCWEACAAAVAEATAGGVEEIVEVPNG